MGQGSSSSNRSTPRYQLRSVANRELLKDMVEMNFDSAFGDGELSCDLFV